MGQSAFLGCLDPSPLQDSIFHLRRPPQVHLSLPPTCPLGNHLARRVSISQTPIGLLLLILAVGAVGILFVLAGHRLLGLTLAILGGILGGVLGAAIAELFLPTAPAWVLATVGAVVMAIAGALSGRLFAAIVLAAVLGFAGVLAVGSADRHGWIVFAGAAEGPRDQTVVVTDPDGTVVERGSIAALRASVSARLEALGAPLRTPAAEARLSRVQSLVADAWSTVHGRWTSSSGPVRTLTLACGAVCAFLGLCLGVLAARWTAAFVTSMLGAALILIAVAAATQQFLGDSSPLPGTRAMWITVWAALAMFGSAVQWWTGREKRRA